MTRQSTANGFSAHGSTWQLVARIPEPKVSPLGGLRPVIGLSAVTALTNAEHWSDTNGEKGECLLFREAEENER